MGLNFKPIHAVEPVIWTRVFIVENITDMLPAEEVMRGNFADLPLADVSYRVPGGSRPLVGSGGVRYDPGWHEDYVGTGQTGGVGHDIQLRVGGARGELRGGDPSWDK